MGMYGGAKRVVRFQCTSCDHLFMKKSDAAVCCDDRAAKIRRTKTEKKIKRMVSNVRVRVDHGRDELGDPIVIARAYHPKISSPAEVRIRYGSRSWSKMTIADAKKKARSLALAQAMRRLRNIAEYN